MIPRFAWRSRLRLCWAILRGEVFLDYTEVTNWGQTIRLRTVEDVEIMEDTR